MSRQYDEYIAGKFELNGSVYQIIEPDSFDELMQALEIRDVIQKGIDQLMHDEDDSGWQDLMEEQEEYIQEYIESIGEFNNGCFVKNLSYLLKKYNVRIGDLEQILGISSGYISRTVKENSSKKMSINVVWKIAKLFNINVQKLIEEDLSNRNGNVGLLVDFIDKLKEQTKSVEIEWENLGGIESETCEMFDEMGFFSKTKEGRMCYAAPDRRKTRIYYLADDVIATYDVDEFRQLVIIPFYVEGLCGVHYDCLFVWPTTDNTYSYEKLFYSNYELSGILDEYAKQLYDEAKEHFYDVPVTNDMRKFIEEYLGKDNSI